MGRKKKKAALSAEQWELVTHGGKCQLCGKALEYPNLACTYDAANSRWTCAAHPYMVLNEKEHRWDMVDTELFHQMDGPRRQAGQQAPADTGEPGERETCPPAHADGGSTAVASTAEARASQTKQESPAAAPNGVLGGGADPSGSAEADAVVERARLRAETRRLRAMVATRDETIAQLESKLEDASYRVLEVQAQARNAGGLLQDATTRAEAAEAEGTRLRDALAEAEDRARAAEAARSEADQEADRHRSQLAAAEKAAAEARAALEQDVATARGEADALTRQLRRISCDMEAGERALREQRGRTEAAEADILSRAASQWAAEAEAGEAGGWASVPVYGVDGPPTHTHGLDSPVLQHLLATWGQEKGEEKRRALAGWLDHVVGGEAVDSHGFVRGVELSSMAPEVSEGVVLLLLPLLRRRTDLHMEVQSRERTVRDLRIRLDPIARPVAERVAESRSHRRRHASVGARSPTVAPSSLHARTLHALAARREGLGCTRPVPVPRPSSAHTTPAAPYSPPSLDKPSSWGPTAAARSTTGGARPSPIAGLGGAAGNSSPAEAPARQAHSPFASPGPGDIPGPDDLAVWLNGEAASAEGAPQLAASAPSGHVLPSRGQEGGEEQFIRRVRERAAQRAARGSRRRQVALGDHR